LRLDDDQIADGTRLSSSVEMLIRDPDRPAGDAGRRSGRLTGLTLHVRSPSFWPSLLLEHAREPAGPSLRSGPSSSRCSRPAPSGSAVAGCASSPRSVC
jgi:hypothetical protein